MEQTYKFEDLKGKTVEQLREIAAGIEHEAVKGYTQLNKEHLLAAICKALNIDMHAHRHVEGISKTEVKTKIKGLRKKRDGFLAASKHDHKQIKTSRRQIHTLKRKLRKAAA